MAQRNADLTGARFGRWLVLGQAESAAKDRRWQCMCDCGTKKAVYHSHLTTARSTSCGCRRREQRHDLTGMRVGRLLALSPAPSSHDGRTRWHCRCDCGGETTLFTFELNAGRVKSCGCIRKDNNRARRGVPITPGTPSYHTAHKRITSIRGRAADYPCVDCGGTARDWSYDHTDPDEVTGPDSRGKVMTYSTDPAHYQPRCVPCHHTFDGITGRPH